MARIKFFVVISIALLISCKDTNIDVVNGVIVFDNSKEYPALNLNLSDLAEVSYVLLGGDERVNFLSLTYELGKQCYVDSNYIIVPDATPYRDVVSKCDDNIYFFSHSGEFIKSFGVGPKKVWDAYSYKNVIVLFPGKIGVYNAFGEGPLVICDYTGRIFKTDSLAKRYTASSVMNNRLILYDGIYKFLKGPDYYKGRALDIYDVDKGVISDFDDLNDIGLPGIKPLHPTKTEWWLYSTTSKTYISNCRTNFVYALDSNLNIAPAFECIHHGTKFPDEYFMVVPLIETDEYILFCNAMDYGAQVEKRYKHGNWIYIKSEQKIYRISDLGYLDDVTEEGQRYIMDKSFGSSVDDKVFLHTFCKTQNSDILVIPVDVEIAKNYMDKLPDNIREQVHSKQPGDNPLLVVMKFGKSIKGKL